MTLLTIRSQSFFQLKFINFYPVLNMSLAHSHSLTLPYTHSFSQSPIDSFTLSLTLIEDKFSQLTSLIPFPFPSFYPIFFSFIHAYEELNFSSCSYLAKCSLGLSNDSSTIEMSTVSVSVTASQLA